MSYRIANSCNGGNYIGVIWHACWRIHHAVRELMEPRAVSFIHSRTSFKPSLIPPGTGFLYRTRTDFVLFAK